MRLLERPFREADVDRDRDRNLPSERKVLTIAVSLETVSASEVIIVLKSSIL